MSRPEGYYESIEAEAKELVEGSTILDLAKILVLTRRQLEESVALHCQNITLNRLKRSPHKQNRF